MHGKPINLEGGGDWPLASARCGILYRVREAQSGMQAQGSMNIIMCRKGSGVSYTVKTTLC
jgi:hypothetical protein